MRLISPRFAAAAVLLVMACGIAQAQKIKVEFDKNVDFSTFKTYAWDPTPQATGKPVLVEAIKGAINQELAKRGLKEVAANPELYVAMYGGIDSDMAVTYSDFYYGPYGIPPFGQSFVMWGMTPGTRTRPSSTRANSWSTSSMPVARNWRGVVSQRRT